MKRFAFLPILLLLSAGFVFSYDFGLFLDQEIEGQNKLFTYTPSFVPWFSWNGGRGLSVYLSGNFSLEYDNSDDGIDENDGWRKPAILPELSWFALSYRSGRGYLIEAGRLPYTDALGVTASGLFDGLRFETSLAQGSISAGLFYTGFLYKETAKIVMTESDSVDYVKPWDFDNFGNYFASRRLLAGFRWDMPLLEFHTLSFEVLAQLDLNGRDEKLHSQYGEAQAEFFTRNNLGITLGAVFETVESGEGDFGLALGALAGLRTEVPGSLNDSLKLTLKFCSGPWNDTFTAFTPLTSFTQGMVFPDTFSGIGLFSADYSVRILPSLFAEGIVSYFVKTFSDSVSDGNLYGGEIWASIAWQPFDDLRASLGAGVFFPGLGNAYPSGTDPMWKISAGLSLSL